MDDLIEAMARASYAKHVKNEITFADAIKPFTDMHRASARTALAAIDAAGYDLVRREEPEAVKAESAQP